MDQRHLLTIVRVAGAAAGVLFGWYTGMLLLIPAGLILLWGVMLHRALKIKTGNLLYALALQAGQVSWVVTGFVLTFKRLDGATGLELALAGGGLLWLFLRPGKPAVIFLSVYQAIGFFFNAFIFAAAPVGTTLNKALAVHMALRLAAVICMYAALKEMRKAGGS